MYTNQKNKYAKQNTIYANQICQPKHQCDFVFQNMLSRGNFFANLITFGLKMRWHTKNYKYEECLCGVTLFVWFTFVWVNTNTQGHPDVWIRICGDLSQKWGHWVEAWGLHRDVYLRKSSAFAAKPFPQLATNQLANNRVGWTITRDWISARCNQSVMIIALLRRMSIKMALEDLILSKREREGERERGET